MMDNFAVDLDKVLDDFEQDEEVSGNPKNPPVVKHTDDHQVAPPEHQAVWGKPSYLENSIAASSCSSLPPVYTNAEYKHELKPFLSQNGSISAPGASVQDTVINSGPLSYAASPATSFTRLPNSLTDPDQPNFASAVGAGMVIDSNQHVVQSGYHADVVMNSQGTSSGTSSMPDTGNEVDSGIDSVAAPGVATNSQHGTLTHTPASAVGHNAEQQDLLSKMENVQSSGSGAAVPSALEHRDFNSTRGVSDVTDTPSGVIKSDDEVIANSITDTDKDQELSSQLAHSATGPESVHEPAVYNMSTTTNTKPVEEPICENVEPICESSETGVPTSSVQPESKITAQSAEEGSTQTETHVSNKNDSVNGLQCDTGMEASVKEVAGTELSESLKVTSGNDENKIDISKRESDSTCSDSPSLKVLSNVSPLREAEAQVDINRLDNDETVTHQVSDKSSSSPSPVAAADFGDNTQAVAPQLGMLPPASSADMEVHPVVANNPGLVLNGAVPIGGVFIPEDDVKGSPKTVMGFSNPEPYNIDIDDYLSGMSMGDTLPASDDALEIDDVINGVTQSPQNVPSLELNNPDTMINQNTPTSVVNSVTALTQVTSQGGLGSMANQSLGPGFVNQSVTSGLTVCDSGLNVASEHVSHSQPGGVSVVNECNSNKQGSVLTQSDQVAGNVTTAGVSLTEQVMAQSDSMSSQQMYVAPPANNHTVQGLLRNDVLMSNQSVVSPTVNQIESTKAFSENQPSEQNTGLMGNAEKAHEPVEKNADSAETGSSSVTDPVLPAQPVVNTGARPKDPSQLKRNRPNSLLGLSKVSLDPKPSPHNLVEYPGSTSVPQYPMPDPSVEATHIDNIHDIVNKQIAEQNRLSLQLGQPGGFPKNQHPNPELANISPITLDSSLTLQGGMAPPGVNSDIPPGLNESIPCQQPSGSSFGKASPIMVGYESEQVGMEGILPGPSSLKQKRPTSLNLLPQGDDPPAKKSPSQDLRLAEDPAILPAAENPEPMQTGGPAPSPQELNQGLMTDLTSNMPPTGAPHLMVAPQFGKVAPNWVPDQEAPNCMQCEARFTFTKRRHHCRACGKVFCSACCSMKWKLSFVGYKDVRVCSRCYQDLIRVEAQEKMQSTHMHPEASAPLPPPDPQNPADYCSTVPIRQQAAATANTPPPTVLVPVGVLKREGSRRQGEPKQVMFSDGIRPGGDLTELDGPAEPRLPTQKSNRTARKVERTSQQQGSNHSGNGDPVKTRITKVPADAKSHSLIPDDGIPPVIVFTGTNGDYTVEEALGQESIVEKIKNSENPDPVVFAVNKNLFILVKILSLECCVNRVCWCFTTRGMVTVGQEELIIIMECLPDENQIPRDVFLHLQKIYEEASKGNTVTEMSHTLITDVFLGSQEYGGFLFIRPTFQCLQKLLLPEPPYLFGILLQKWEIPWAKVFPIRLMLRLGAEFRYYPCPLISVRNRKPVFAEIGHTIINLLADFRNYQYMLPHVRGSTIHMEDKKTCINFPKNRYDEVMKVVNASNEHVMALSANFSVQADSHLVCIQNEHGHYQTQAINIQNKPREITGASFVVFNGALKSSSGLRAKSSIVEDGLMVQINVEAMMELKQALRDMKDFIISCGSLENPAPEEQIFVTWTDEDKRVNLGVKSPIDNKVMDGIESVRIRNATDYIGENRTVRWTEVFFIQQEDSGNSRGDPVDLSRLAETLAVAFSIALTPHLDKLKEAVISKIGLRVTIDADTVGYEVGANGEKLPDFYMNELDNELIPVIHSAASNTQGGPVVLELIFHVIE